MRSESNPEHVGQPDKQALRKRARRALAEIGEDAAWAAGIRVAAHLTAWQGWSDLAALALFSSLPGEVACRPLFAAARDAGKRILLPRMASRRTLDFVAIEDLESLRPGPHGVLEPGAEMMPEELGADMLVAVPGLAFDRRGGRLGRGAGYYDTTLAAAEKSIRGGRLLIVGVGFDLQTVDRVPMQPHDVRMDGLVTETSLVWFG